MTTDYTTTAAVNAELGSLLSTADQLLVDVAVTAASRQIDDYCGQSFWQDPTVTTREFYADSSGSVDLMDVDGIARAISTTTGLIVKLDEAGNGTFGTTTTIGTDFLLLPRNATADGLAFTEVLMADNYAFPRYRNGRAGVQITAKFGWPTVPAVVEKACRLQAIQLFKSKDTPFGATVLGDVAPLFMKASLHPIAKGLLAGVRRVGVG